MTLVASPRPWCAAACRMSARSKARLPAVPPEAKPKGQSHLRREGYERAKTLAEAVKLAKSQLALDGKPEYAALLSEGRVRDAIRTAITSWEVFQQDAEERRF